MNNTKRNTIKRSKSLSSLQTSILSEPSINKESSNELTDPKLPGSFKDKSSDSVDVEVVIDSELESSDGGHDGGIGDEVFVMLEQRIDMLNDLFMDQCRLLSDIKTEVRNSRSALEKTEIAQNKLVVELLKKALDKSKSKELEDDPERDSFNSRARSLLDAIETRQASCLDDDIRDALVEFLQSDDLRAHMVSATVESVREMIRTNFTRDVSVVYLPLLERSQRRLARQVTRALETAFVELENHSASFSNSIYKATRSLRRALERHQALVEDSAAAGSHRLSYLQYAVEEVIQKELKLWRQEAMEGLCAVTTGECSEIPEPDSPPTLDYPISPPQPADPDCSIIDQLVTMQSLPLNITSSSHLHDQHQQSIASH